MIVWKSLLDWLLYDAPIKYKSKFKMEKDLLPYNTILDSRFLILDSNDRETRVEILNGIEEFYKNSAVYITVRQEDYSIVIVNPFIIKSDGILHIGGSKYSCPVFIGKQGKDIAIFKEELNKKIEKKFNRPNTVKEIKLHEIVC